MTIQEFNDMRFGAGMQVQYRGKVYPIESIDFQEQLIAICETGIEDEEFSWKRCENCELIPEPVTSDHRTEIFA